MSNAYWDSTSARLNAVYLAVRGTRCDVRVAARQKYTRHGSMPVRSVYFCRLAMLGIFGLPTIIELLILFVLVSGWGAGVIVLVVVLTGSGRQ